MTARERDPAADHDGAGGSLRLLLENLLFTVVVPGTVGVYVPLRIAVDESAGPGFARVAGGALLLIGTGIYAWCVWDFASFGRGTPAPIDAPKRLVVRGLYRFTRNPMYVGVLTVIAGWAAVFRSLPLLRYAAVVGLCFHVFIVLYEERRLRREFGDEYEAYRGRVGRWLLRPRGARRVLSKLLGNLPVLLALAIVAAFSLDVPFLLPWKTETTYGIWVVFVAPAAPLLVLAQVVLWITLPRTRPLPARRTPTRGANPGESP